VAFKTLGAGAAGTEDSDPGIVAEINITPLTDIFLVLLIIFMVTSSVMSQMGVEVKLPKAGAVASSTAPDGVIVTLLPGGALRVNQQAIPARNGVPDYADLESKLGAALSKSKSRYVILEGDRQALLGNAIEVMDHARKAGAESFAVATASGGQEGHEPSSPTSAKQTQ